LTTPCNAGICNATKVHKADKQEIAKKIEKIEKMK
jgi:hypothetical protein